MESLLTEGFWHTFLGVQSAFLGAAIFGIAHNGEAKKELEKAEKLIEEIKAAKMNEYLFPGLSHVGDQIAKDKRKVDIHYNYTLAMYSLIMFITLSASIIFPDAKQHLARISVNSDDYILSHEEFHIPADSSKEIHQLIIQEQTEERTDVRNKYRMEVYSKSKIWLYAMITGVILFLLQASPYIWFFRIKRRARRNLAYVASNYVFVTSPEKR